MVLTGILWDGPIQPITDTVQFLNRVPGFESRQGHSPFLRTVDGSAEYHRGPGAEVRTNVTPSDRIRTRTVQGLLALIQEHLEAMRRDMHGLEYDPWKREVDALWKRIFEQIGRMADGPQESSLLSIREEWTTYLTHYVSL
jgi:hypothetical protein